jgi:GxxExxY protein
VDDEIRDPLTEAVIGAAIEVHRELGPGLLEEIYQRALEVELELRGVPFTAQEPLPVSYKGVFLGKGLNMDFVVRNELIIELKSVDASHPVHTAQLLTYMKIRKLPKGLLLNFNVRLLKDGIRRLVL